MIEGRHYEQPLGSRGHRVLIVEDDDAISVALQDGFRFEGFQVDTAKDGESALAQIETVNPDILILDVMLPKLNGLDLCRKLRSEGNQVPILMLTARGTELDKVLGLKLGADDYVTKPFSMMEVITRAEAILRRVHGVPKPSGPTHYAFGDVTLDFKKHEARKGDRLLDLSPREFLLLEFFIHHRREVVSRDQLLDAVWGFDQIPFTRTVDTHIAKLRKKIEPCAATPRYIVTVHRLGYKFLG